MNDQTEVNDESRADGQSRLNVGLATEFIYSRKYDSYYQASTGKWVEKKCSDPNCEFCKDRPDVANV